MTAPPPAPCQYLTWDSDHFGFPIARVTGATLSREAAGDVEAWCRNAGIRCAYFKADAGDTVSAWIAEDAGFRLVDVRLSFEIRLDTTPPLPGDAPLRAGVPEDLPRLEAIARTAYPMTRFFTDRNFPIERAEALYATWIRRSLAGLADAVLVSGPPGDPAGFVSCHRSTDALPARIGLVGLAAEHQGRGLGVQLVCGALEWFRTAGAKSVEVATQARNLRAQRLYQRCGFRTGQATVWFHRWWA